MPAPLKLKVPKTLDWLSKKHAMRLYINTSTATLQLHSNTAILQLQVQMLAREPPPLNLLGKPARLTKLPSGSAWYVASLDHCAGRGRRQIDMLARCATERHTRRWR